MITNKEETLFKRDGHPYDLIGEGIYISPTGGNIAFVSGHDRIKDTNVYKWKLDRIIRFIGFVILDVSESSCWRIKVNTWWTKPKSHDLNRI